MFGSKLLVSKDEQQDDDDEASESGGHHRDHRPHRPKNANDGAWMTFVRMRPFDFGGLIYQG